MRRLVTLCAIIIAAVSCRGREPIFEPDGGFADAGFDVDAGVEPDAGVNPTPVVSCVDTPTDLPRPPNGPLPCDMLPPR